VNGIPNSILLVATGTSTTGDSAASWTSLIIRELGRSQTAGFVLDLVKWTILGAILGALLAILACVLFSRPGWYDLRVRFARGLRWTVFTAIVLLSTVLFAMAGFWSGALSGSERVLSKSQLATDVFPKIADVIAEGMAWIQVRATQPENISTNEMTLKLDAFRAGKWELHAEQFQTQLDEFRNDSIVDGINWLERTALERTPKLRGGLGEKLLHKFLHGLGRLLVEKKANSQLKSWGTDRVYSAIREQLIAEARKAGDPETISHRDASAFIVHQGIVPGLMKPVRTTARAQQLPLLGIALMAMVVPPACVRLARSRFGQQTRQSPASSLDRPPTTRDCN
jgi:hypothetical protein